MQSWEQRVIINFNIIPNDVKTIENSVKTAEKVWYHAISDKLKERKFPFDSQIPITNYFILIRTVKIVQNNKANIQKAKTTQNEVNKVKNYILSKNV